MSVRVAVSRGVGLGAIMLCGDVLFAGAGRCLVLCVGGGDLGRVER
jgi:hypothetical protein